MSERRLKILSPNGALVFPDAERALMRGKREADLGPPAMIDLSDIPNANAAAPFEVVVEQRCDMGQWHQIGRVVLPCWSDDAWREKERKP